MSLVVLTALTASLTVSATPDGPWKIAPQLQVGQEVTYTGTHVEVRTTSGGAKLEQPSALDVGYLVLRSNPLGETNIGVQTTRRPDGINLPKLSTKNPHSKPDASINNIEYHLAKITVDKDGNLSWTDSRANVLLPPYTAPVDELSFGLKVPKTAVRIGQRWRIARAGLPATHVQVVGFERIQAAACAKLKLKQESENFQDKEITGKAWSKETTMWVETGTGLVYKVHRVHRLRDSKAPLAEHYYKTSYELASNFKFHGQVFQERYKEFDAAIKWQDAFEKALAAKTNYERSNQLKLVKDGVNMTLKKDTFSPYRMVMYRLLNQVDHESQIDSDDGSPAKMVFRSTSLARRGTKARSFVARGLDGKTKWNPQELLGNPYILVFVDNPTDMLSKQAVRECVIASQCRTSTKILVICRKAEKDKVEHLQETVPGNYELCQGGGLDRAYGLKVYPHVVVVDSEGYMQERFEGVGPELRPGVTRVLKMETQTEPTEKVARPKIKMFNR